MFPASSERVPTQTSARVNRRIQEQTEANVECFASADPETIEKRLHQLDREWDVERTLEANAASIALAGIALGAVNKKWLILPAAVAAFLLQHALQGWCPPLPILRRLGFRTRVEIDREKFALKTLRGDFSRGFKPDRPDSVLRVMEAVRK
jgi:hypothetical protein